MIRNTIVSSRWAAVLAVATLAAAHGQDATRSGTQSANQSSTTASESAPSAQPEPATAGGEGSTAGAQSATGAKPAAGAESGAGSQAAKPSRVCFKLTGRCVDSAKAPSAKAGTAGDGSGQRTLNLTAPDVRSVVPADQLKEPLASNEQITETQEADTVSVKGNKDLQDVPLGFGAIWWALNHPSQAWRIFTPEE